MIDICLSKSCRHRMFTGLLKIKIFSKYTLIFNKVCNEHFTNFVLFNSLSKLNSINYLQYYEYLNNW